MVSTREKYINPFTDFGFKRLFGEYANKDLLIDFLNEIIKEQGKITDIQYLKSEQLGRSEFDCRAIFDIYCQNERGEKFIVEMQKAKQNYFKDRSVFYATFPIQEQSLQGNWNFELKAVYMIGILDFIFDEDKNDQQYFHHEVKLMDTCKKRVFYDKLTFIYLEMPKFNKDEKELENRFDKWMYVLKNLPKLEQRPHRLQERVFENLFKTAEIAAFTPMEAQEYEDSLKAYRDLKNVIDTSWKDGMDEGIERGKAEGIAEGIAEGMKQEKIAVALKCMQKGMSINDIADITGLSKQQIETLQS